MMQKYSKGIFGKMISKNSGSLITNEKITDIMKSIMSGYPEFAKRITTQILINLVNIYWNI